MRQLFFSLVVSMMTTFLVKHWKDILFFLYGLSIEVIEHIKNSSNK